LFIAPKTHGVFGHFQSADAWGGVHLSNLRNKKFSQNKISIGFVSRNIIMLIFVTENETKGIPSVFCSAKQAEFRELPPPPLIPVSCSLRRPLEREKYPVDGTQDICPN
jgi:hypothetical protein